ncbi:hypothetical protein KP509_1Z108900 [Ceratopteris richardii]|nr:hypothetical protein KP509_1Z108900 [Ceratopteris richardii]
MTNSSDSLVQVREGPEPGYFEVHVQCPKRPTVVELIIIAIERMASMLYSVNLLMEPSIPLSVVAKKVQVRAGPEPGYFEVHVQCPKRPTVVELIIIAIERMASMLYSVNLLMEPSISLSVVAKKVCRLQTLLVSNGRTIGSLA